MTPGRNAVRAAVALVKDRHITMSKAVAQWIKWMESVGHTPNTVTNHRFLIEAWVRDVRLESYRPSAVRALQIDQWINDPKSTTKAHTRMVNLSCIRSFFAFCTARGWCSGDPSLAVAVAFRNLSPQQKEITAREPFTEAELV